VEGVESCNKEVLGKIPMAALEDDSTRFSDLIQLTLDRSRGNAVDFKVKLKKKKID
jgi:hypothetical protein